MGHIHVATYVHTYLLKTSFFCGGGSTTPSFPGTDDQILQPRASEISETLSLGGAYMVTQSLRYRALPLQEFVAMSSRNAKRKQYLRDATKKIPRTTEWKLRKQCKEHSLPQSHEVKTPGATINIYVYVCVYIYVYIYICIHIMCVCLCIYIQVAATIK